MSGFRLANEDFDRIFITEEEVTTNFFGSVLYGWGVNSSGQLGNNATTSRSSPVTTAANLDPRWKQIAVGNDGVAAVKTDGTLWTWGDNFYGQLGTSTNIARSSPQTTIAGGADWKQVAVGEDHMAAIKPNGSLWTWGRNQSGQLGTGNNIDRSSPQTTVAGGTDWKQVSCGNINTAAVKTDGTLWTWGDNFYGQLGNSTNITRSSPQTTVAGGTNWKQVAIGTIAVAIKTDGTLWTWGDNFYGQLGSGNTTSRDSPQTTVAGGTDWKQVAAGLNHSTAIKNNGTLWTWGYNNVGQLGNGTAINRSSPQTTAGGGTDWKSVSLTTNASFAIKSNGKLFGWGQGTSGALGTGNTITRSSPVSITGGVRFKSIALSSGQSTMFALSDESNTI